MIPNSHLKSIAPVVEVRDLGKTYTTLAGDFVALKAVNLRINPGEYVAIMGPSGSGKSTFMNLLGCLDKPSHGEYWLNGKNIAGYNSDELAHIRGESIGFVFQGFNLLPRLSLLDNVALPMIYRKIPKPLRQSRATALLTQVGLARVVDSLPNRISGGQQQRVAIARALVNNPSLILADEPTGNLDSKTSEEIMTMFTELNRQGITIVLVTHEHDIASNAKRVVHFHDGEIVSDTMNTPSY